MEDTKIELIALTEEQMKQFRQVTGIEDTSKIMTSSFYIILLICNVLLLIFRDRENAGTIVMAAILFMMMWTMINLFRLNKKRVQVLTDLHKSGLTYAQIKGVLELMKNERNDEDV